MSALELRSHDLANYYALVRGATHQLQAGLTAEDCAIQSMPDTSPTKWHLAHTTWFFETFVLEPNRKDFRPYHPSYRHLFNSYYNTVGTAHPRPERGLLSRPSLADVLAYREHVDAQVVLAVEKEELDEGPRAVLELGLHHEQQHQELILMDIQHVFSCNPLRPAYRELPSPPIAAPGPLAWKAFEEGLRGVGHGGDGFAFDNETKRHRVWMEAFELADRLVTAGEYLEFIEDGGYERPELWLSDGWARVQAEGWRAPLYWQLGPDGWQVFTLSGTREVRRDLPVCHVSFYEADAFARWAGWRLPSEFEWEIAATYNDELSSLDGNFVEEDWLQPIGDRGGKGLRQMFGDVWEWTASAYAPYPGYRPALGALGEYNGKFMSSQIVLRGGCCVTPRSHIRATYRNFFFPQQRWQFAGIRLARDGS